MTENGQPKFCIGDLVLIVHESTVGKIVKYYFINQKWYYSLEGRTELFLEDSLSPIRDNQMQHENRENILISYKFQLGDIVQVKGYGEDLFFIIGFRVEIWRYKDSAWEDIIYELSRIKDGQWLEASEEELTYITNEQNGKKLLMQRYPSEKRQLLQPSKLTNQEKRKTTDIDELLDMYNDYQYLFLNFGEAKYKKKMKEILKKLEALAKSPFQKD
ncbi:hypothetical protein [Fervidibacillus halotolerans]|uniref:YodN n=1 Tax=Fervidibacillus halotolerans TaxID=2980027 RepID=A0A9E8M0T6_9BACI|nr:hypothetical protein [Fervidibacillus halotolerans]WAA13287.1 hypothetical protein OE105_03965 [Fervidibacillus halotolerans]